MREKAVFSVGEEAILTEETEDKILEQDIRILRLAEGDDFPFWASEGDEVWIVEALDDGPLLDAGEEDYARVENLEKTDQFD